MNKEFLKQLKKNLEEKRRFLTKKLFGFAKKDKKLKGDFDTKFPDFGTHKDDNIAEVVTYESTLPVEHKLETKLQAIKRALLRLKRKKYGICSQCGKRIEPKRLEALPETDICIGCSKKRGA